MADAPQTLALTVLAQNYAGDIVRQINRSAATLSILPVVKGEGKNCAWVAEGDGHIAENASDGADAANFGSDEQLSAVLPWGIYRSNFRVTGLAQAAAGSSATPQGNVALWARNMINASAKLASALNAALYNGAGTGTTLAGLAVAVGDATNTYAGLARGTYTYWRPNVNDPGTPTAPTFALIREDLREIYEACGEVPDVAFVKPDVFNKIGSLFDASRQYNYEITTAAGVKKLDASFGAIEFDGCMFIKDKDATANCITYLNTRHVRIEVLDPNPPAQSMAAKVGSSSEGALPFGFTVEALAKLGDSDRAQLKSYMQLVVDKPNSCGVRLNVSV